MIEPQVGLPRSFHNNVRIEMKESIESFLSLVSI